MNLVADPASPSWTASTPNRLVRVWRAPVWVHVLALALVLLGIMGIVGTSGSFSADEGAAIVQARSLSRGDGWLVDHPMPQVDPAGANYPLELSARGPSGVAPYAKHPLYPLLLAGADRLGGVAAMVLLSMVGALAAAGLAAALARRLASTLARPALWVVGLASPLVVDGYLVIAHALGAALAAAAVLAAIVAIERRSPILGLAVVPLVAACVLLRNEALFLAGALAVVGAVVGVRRPDARLAASVVSVGALVAGAGAHVVDGVWTARVVGSGGGRAIGSAAPAAGDSMGLVAGRVQGLVVTWLTPSYGGRPVTGLALLLMLVAIIAATVTIRTRPERGGRITAWALVAAGAAVVAIIADPHNVVPGLLLAFPLAGCGLLLVGRGALRSITAGVTSGVSMLVVAAVLATQYAKGGSGEWGGRYFALVLPVAVPVLLLAMRDQRSRLDRSVARAAVAGLAVCSVALSMMGVGALRSTHRANTSLVAAIARAGRTADPGLPVIVTTEGAMPRLAWSTFDDQRWLLTTPDGLADLLSRVRVAGATKVAFVSRHLPRDQIKLDGAGVRVLSIDRSQSARRWQILVIEIT